LNKIFILFNYKYTRKTSSLTNKNRKISETSIKINYEWMIAMQFMSCKNKCVYQLNGICELESLIPERSGPDEPCVRFIPAAAAQRGLLHRYFEPGLTSYRSAQTTYQHDVQESDTS
jgi:hypothetical protein